MKTRIFTAAFMVTMLAFSAASAATSTTDGSVAFAAYNSWLTGWSSFFATNHPTTTLFSSFNGTFTGGQFSSIVGNVYAFNVPTTGSLFSEVFIWNSTQGTIFANSPVPVPGPEAGAGIGALALAGLAYALNRRRALAA